jgi:hypothetical protein
MFGGALATVASLWVGGPLGYIQKLCLSSFVYYGHTINLYVYDMDMDVPQGVTKLDASEIVPQDKVFTYHGQYAGFSDYFRYKMIQSTGVMWVDADTLCLTKDFFEDTEFVFIQESKHLIAGGILKMPKSHQLTKIINSQTEKLIPQITKFPDKEKWAVIGPLLLTKLVRRFHLEKYAQPAAKVNVLDHWSKGEEFWDPAKAPELLSLCEGAYCATMFTGTLRARGFDTDQVPPKGSAISYFATKFGLQ